MVILLAVLLVVVVLHVAMGFVPSRIAMRSSSSSVLSMSLDAGTLTRLEDMREQYDRLSNVVSPEAEAEMKGMEDVVEKYRTLKEIKIMLGKLRSMWRSEASERRRAKQLKSFLQLCKGRVEIEKIIADKLGVPIEKDAPVPELVEVEALDAEIVSLEAALKKQEIKMPEGMSTREARFGALP